MSKLVSYKATAVVGVDEAGRGCLAGPVVAAAVMLPKGARLPLLNDSKKLTPKNREKLFPLIQQKALAYGIGVVDQGKIDEINILQAAVLAMHQALDQIKEKMGVILVDGNYFHPYHKVPHECVIKGDGKYRSIAAASVLAKTHRDHLMIDLHEQYPDYGWNQNMGYPTKAHRQAIAKVGTTPYHRQSFNLLPNPEN